MNSMKLPMKRPRSLSNDPGRPIHRPYKHDADPDQAIAFVQKPPGSTPPPMQPTLTSALIGRHTSEIQRLLDERAKVREVICWQQNPFELATAYFPSEPYIVGVAMAMAAMNGRRRDGGDVLKFDVGCNMLTLAIAHDNSAEVIGMLINADRKTGPSNAAPLQSDIVNQHDGNGDTPLMKAVKTGNIAIAEQLLNAGAAVDVPNRSPDYRSSRTPLMQAAYDGNAEMVMLLLSREASVRGRVEMEHNAITLAGFKWNPVGQAEDGTLGISDQSSKMMSDLMDKEEYPYDPGAKLCMLQANFGRILCEKAEAGDAEQLIWILENYRFLITPDVLASVFVNAILGHTKGRTASPSQYALVERLMTDFGLNPFAIHASGGTAHAPYLNPCDLVDGGRPSGKLQDTKMFELLVLHKIEWAYQFCEIFHGNISCMPILRAACEIGSLRVLKEFLDFSSANKAYVNFNVLFPLAYSSGDSPTFKYLLDRALSHKPKSAKSKYSKFLASFSKSGGYKQGTALSKRKSDFKKTAEKVSLRDKSTAMFDLAVNYLLHQPESLNAETAPQIDLGSELLPLAVKLGSLRSTDALASDMLKTRPPEQVLAPIMHLAAKYGNLDVLDWLTKHPQWNSDFLGRANPSLNDTPLMVAGIHKKREFFEKVLDMLPDYLWGNPEDPMQILHAAINLRSIKGVSMMIERGADLNRDAVYRDYERDEVHSDSDEEAIRSNALDRVLENIRSDDDDFILFLIKSGADPERWINGNPGLWTTNSVERAHRERAIDSMKFYMKMNHQAMAPDPRD